MKLESGPFITRHALERFQQHFPGAGFRFMLFDIKDGFAIDSQMAALLTGRRPPRAQSKSQYILSSRKQGIHVLEPSQADKMKNVVVTYLRLPLEQQQFAEEQWIAA